MKKNIVKRLQDLAGSLIRGIRRRESEELFSHLVDEVEDYAIFGLDRTGHIISWNKGAQRSKGYLAEEIIGQHFSRFYTREDIQSGKPEQLLRRASEDGRVKDEGWRVRKDGSRFFADVVITAIKDKTGSLKGFTKVTRDITQRRELDERLLKTQAELFQSNKLESIGRLAGGVAHDFNNLITGILGISQDVQRTFPPEDPRRAEMEELIKASNRAFDVTRQLLAFSRLQIASPKVIDINGTIKDFMKLLTRLLGEDIKLKFELSEQSQVRMDPGHLDQILLNLALNARDAMPKGGVILIQTANVDHAQEDNVRPVPHVLLEVTDTGTGMNPEILAHIFEPFFTTKTKDRGTGLGLATVYGIVKQNGGDIFVHSQVGNGTTFRIYLPREFHAAERAQPPKAIGSRGGNETILVVEDEDIVRRVVVRRLKSVGYTVLEASDPHQALDLCKKMGSSIHLVITDVIMPGLNGREVIERIRATHPDMAVLYMSAYPDEIITHRGILDPGINFLEKSAIQQDLFRAVREALSKASESRTVV